MTQPAQRPTTIPDCALPSGDLQTQLDRYRRLGTHATGIARQGLRLVIAFSPALDEKLLGETLSVERGCCSFFTLGYDPSRRRLTVAVDDASRIEALEAIRGAVAGGESGQRGR